MSVVCNKCNFKISKTRSPGINCGGQCKKVFHVRCALISKELLQDINNRSATWLCLDCRPASSQSVIDCVDDDTLDSQVNLLSLNDIMLQLKRMELKLSALDDLKAIVASVRSENEALKSRVDTLEKQLAIHSTKLHLLHAENDRPLQQQNKDSITIRGLPLNHDDVRGVVINTISKFGVDIQPSDILSIQKVQKSTEAVSSNNNNMEKEFQHNFLNVKLSSSELKNKILLQTVKVKSISTQDLDVFLPVDHPAQRIFIMHRLTAFQSQLYREAKIMKSKYLYKYLWCKSGQIFLRKSADSDVHRIHSFNDIFRLQRFHHPVGNS